MDAMGLNTRLAVRRADVHPHPDFCLTPFGGSWIWHLLPIGCMGLGEKSMLNVSPLLTR